MTIKLCNCAECGCELLGDSMREWHRGLSDGERANLPPLVYLRLHGRPYCMPCGARRPPPAGRGTGGDPSPWQENAVRHLEDADS